MKIGFDNEKYLKMQSEHIRNGSISSVTSCTWSSAESFLTIITLPAFCRALRRTASCSMLMQLADQAEIVIVISAADIEKNKVRGDLGITYDTGRAASDRRLPRQRPVCRQRRHHSVFRSAQPQMPFKTTPGKSGHQSIQPLSDRRLSDQHSSTSSAMKATAKTNISRPPVRWLSSPPRDRAAEKWQPASLSSTMSTNAASRPAMRNLRPSRSGIMPLKHPVNLAYEAATADLNDVNMIDPFHLEAYGEDNRQLQP